MLSMVGYVSRWLGGFTEYGDACTGRWLGGLGAGTEMPKFYPQLAVCSLQWVPYLTQLWFMVGCTMYVQTTRQEREEFLRYGDNYADAEVFSVFSFQFFSFYLSIFELLLKILLNQRPRYQYRADNAKNISPKMN